jgi:hypothetical protein
MRIETDPRLPSPGSVDYDRNLRNRFYDLFRSIARQLNGVTEGQIAVVTNAATAAPSGTAQTYQQGDTVRNSAPTELGTAGNKYIITHWTCVAAGAPGTWLPCRSLTGN